MNTLNALVWVINIFSGLAIIFLVLMQQGKGADAGAAFGGSSQGVFGAAGSANFLSRSTATAAIIFFITCLILAYSASHRGSVTINTPAAAAPVKEVAPAAGATKALPDSLPAASKNAAKGGEEKQAGK